MVTVAASLRPAWVLNKCGASSVSYSTSQQYSPMQQVSSFARLATHGIQAQVLVKERITPSLPSVRVLSSLVGPRGGRPSLSWMHLSLPLWANAGKLDATPFGPQGRGVCARTLHPYKGNCHQEVFARGYMQILLKFSKNKSVGLHNCSFDLQPMIYVYTMLLLTSFSPP